MLPRGRLPRPLRPLGRLRTPRTRTARRPRAGRARLPRTLLLTPARLPWAGGWREVLRRLLGALVLLGLAGLLALPFLLSGDPDPPAPDAPAVRAPHAQVPHVGVHGPRVPRPSLPGVSSPRLPRPSLGPPSVSGPDVSLPDVPDVSAPSLPDAGLDSSSSDDDDGPEILRRSVRLHDHHWSLRFLWDDVWGPLAIALVAVAAVVLLRLRVPPPPRPWRGRSVAAALAAALAALLVAQAVTVPSTAGAPLVRGPVTRDEKVEVDGTRVITTTHHFHHLHPPIRVSVPLLVLACGCAGVAGTLGGQALIAWRRRPRPPRRRPPVPSGLPL